MTAELVGFPSLADTRNKSYVWSLVGSSANTDVIEVLAGDELKLLNAIGQAVRLLVVCGIDLDANAELWRRDSSDRTNDFDDDSRTFRCRSSVVVCSRVTLERAVSFISPKARESLLPEDLRKPLKLNN